MNEKSDILLVGNPNVGKSTIFNALTGLKQHTGNWTGKTVSAVSGIMKNKDSSYTITDTPGTYALLSNSPEEEVTIETLYQNPNALTLVIADATCLCRNLLLLFQVMQAANHVALCVNLMDEAEKKGIHLNLNRLEENLGIPVIAMTARKQKNMGRLKNFLCSNLENKPTVKKITYTQEIENATKNIVQMIQNVHCPIQSPEFIAQKFLLHPQLAKKLLREVNFSDKYIEEIYQIALQEKRNLLQKGLSVIDLQDNYMETWRRMAEAATIAAVTKHSENIQPYQKKIDRILTSKILGIPIMLAFLALILWITISAANIPSAYLSKFFNWFHPHFLGMLTALHLPEILISILSDGVYRTLTWVISVMLPPMAIFFPLFTLLEDLGYLPRIAFNLDKYFKKAGTSGKNALTMCMGLGCNAVGVTGCRIISSDTQRLTAILTNTFMPCNGRFGILILLSTLITRSILGKENNLLSVLLVILIILVGIAATLAITKLLNRIYFKSENPTFILELPPYRKPQILKTLYHSLVDRTLTILGRAITVSAPAGAILWILSAMQIGEIPLLQYLGDFLDPLGHILGLDGFILLAFFLALPANEIVLPILLMCYLSANSMIEISDVNLLSDILCQQGWTILTAVNMMLFSLLHFPCGTTLYTIYKETHSIRWTVLSFVIPILTACMVCCTTNLFYHIFL